MNTEKLVSLLAVFKNGISHAPGEGLNNVLAYQDVIGRSTMAEIRAFDAGLDREARRHFTWVNFCTLDQDMAVNIIKETMVRRYRKEVRLEAENIVAECAKDYGVREARVFVAEQRLTDAKRSIWRRITGLKKKLAKAEQDLRESRESEGRLRSQLVEARAELRESNLKARKYDELKRLLA